MPYIKQERRRLVKNDMRPRDAGELNYIITRVCHEFIESHGINYHTLNTVMGVLMCVSKELYRQVVAPYEDKKKSENGPVSTLDK